MWTYFQRTGGLVDPGGVHIATGYSGRGAGQNNPQMEFVKAIGPIPEGAYTIGGLIPEDGEHGPDVLPLTPDATNHMGGRSGFLIHGDEISSPGCASHGCIILDRATRLKICASDDERLYVTA